MNNFWIYFNFFIMQSEAACLLQVEASDRVGGCETEVRLQMKNKNFK